MEKFEKRYVDSLPEVGLVCPDCQIGTIKQGKFSPYCPNCKCFFNLSGGKTGNYSTPTQKSQGQGFQRVAEPKKQPPILENLATKEDIETILEALRKTYAEIQAIKKITDKFSNENKIVIYPKDEEGN